MKITKRKNKGKAVGAIVGTLFGLLIVAGVICYFKVPAFREWLTNGWQELFKKK